LLFVAFLISGASFWQNYSTEHEISEVDIAILTDDLPIHIYVD
jgi:CHASE3 domain sensor protein